MMESVAKADAVTAGSRPAHTPPVGGGGSFVHQDSAQRIST